MGEYLLVAHQTAEGQELVDAALAMTAHDPLATFTLLVPATPVGALLTWEEGEARDVARNRARSASAGLQRSGVNVIAVRIGDADPVAAIDDDILTGRRYDAIVISTLPAGLSRWIRMDVVSRLRRQRPHQLVIHVVAAAAHRVRPVPPEQRPTAA
ncbi:MAG TPA: hypothetical protein VKE27_13690 [Candidatus Dormibacteraeota bacterium]|nr:hypothetical protein [Candidatus Dormibacteraeota bacterium]